MGHMGHAASAALGVYKPRRPQASPLFAYLFTVQSNNLALTAARAFTLNVMP